MAFTLHTVASGPIRYDDDARYAIRDNGVLVVQVESVKRVYSPLGWTWIEDEGSGEMTSLEW
jgi:hypothetical protein